jgi:hypothetical protein
VTDSAAHLEFLATNTSGCSKCVPDLGGVFFDSLTQTRLPALVESRKGFLELHVHAPDTLDLPFCPRGGRVILFRLVLYIAANMPVVYWTPRSLTLEGAFSHLEDCLRREKRRLKSPRVSRVLRK